MPNEIDDELEAIVSQREVATKRCRTCKLPEVERDRLAALARGFEQKRKNGEVMAWLTFAKLVKASKRGYPYGERSYLAHIEKCLGIPLD